MAPSVDVRRRYLVGSANPAELAQVEAYLMTDPAAATALAELTPEDSFLAALQIGGSDESNDLDLESLIGRLRTATDSTPSVPAADAPTMTESGEMGGDGPATWGVESPILQDEIGRLGPYRLLSLLGRGGMGLVFEAEDPELGRRLALKTMRRDLAVRTSARERFQREGRAAARLEHDHIVPIFGVGEANGIPYIAMPLLRGESLDARLKREICLPVSEAARICREVAEGLAAAHDAGMIHRDVKPGNVWLEAPRDRVKLLDFGLARKADGHENLTQSGAIVGTPAYMAPEQARGRGVDHRADLFSLGVLLYEMTTGYRPFTGPDPIAILTSIAIDTPLPPHQVNPAIPAGLSDLILRLLDKNPDRRVASARQAADALANPDFRLAPTTADPTVELILPPVAAGRSRRSRRRLAVAALVLLIAAATISFTVIRVQGRTGTLVIETDDSTIAMVVKQDGVTIRDQLTNREINLKVGDYTIELAEPKEGLKLSTDKFSITKNGREVVKVWLEKPIAQPQIGAPVPGPESDRDRAVAEWVLSKKGYVTVTTPSGLRTLQAPQKLFSGPIQLFEVGLHRPQSGPLSSAELDRLLDVTRLTHLQVHGNALDDAWLGRMVAAPGFAHLQLLDLGLTEITSSGLAPLARLNELSTVRLYSMKNLTDGGLQHLAEIKSLRSLQLSGTAPTVRGLEFLVPLPLKELTVGFLKGADAEVVRVLARMATLETLVVNGPIFGNAAMAELSGLKGLKWLSVADSDLSGPGLRHLARFPELEKLDLYGLSRLDDAALVELEDLPVLKRLKVQDCPVTDAGLDHIVKCRGLKELNLARTQVTVAGARKLAAARPDLKIEFDGKAVEPAAIGTDRDDRKFAEWVLSKGAIITIQNEQWVQKVEELPNGPIKLVDITFGWRPASPRPAADLEGLLNAPSTRRLVLGNFPITDAWIERMSHAAGLRQVQDLYIWGVASTATSFPHLADLPKLESLTLSDLPLSDDGMKDLSRSKSLRKLTLQKTGITPRGIEHLRPLGLTWLSLGETELKAMSGDPNGWKVLTRSASLQALILNGAPVPVSAFAEFTALPELSQLNVVRTGINREGLKLLAKLPRLNMLYANFEDELDGQALGELPAFPALQVVGLGDMIVTDAGLDQLGKCPKLASLQLTRTKVTAAGLQKLATARPDLKVVLDGKPVQAAGPDRDDRAFAEWVLSTGCRFTIGTEQKPVAILKGGKLPPGPCQVLEVYLQPTPGQPRGVEELKRLLDVPPLRHLQIVGFPATDEWVEQMTRAPGLRQLRSLELTSGPLTNVGLVQLAILPNLEKLCFVNQKQVSDDGMKALARSQSLRELWINLTPVTDAGLDHLATCPHLELLYLSRTKVTDEGVKRFRAACPNCRVSEYWKVPEPKK